MTADEAAPERLHPLAILSGLGKAARNVFGGIAAGGYFAFQGQGLLAITILGGIAVVTVGGLLLHWLRFSFRVGQDAIRIDSGILNRNHRTIPFDRVADVSIAQGPLQRLFGIASVTLETGGSAAGKEEGDLDGIGLDRAEALRDSVRARRGIRTAAPVESDEIIAAPPLFAMDSKRVLTCGVFNFSLAIFAGLFGASQTFGDLFKIDPFEREFWQPILLESGWGDWLLDHRLGLALGGLAVLLLAGTLTGLIRTTLREWGFRLERVGNGLRRRRGLLTRTDVSLPLRRIQAGVIATGPIRDHFGWRTFTVQSLASDGAQSEGGNASDHVLAPLASDEEIALIAAEIGLDLPTPETDWRPVSRAHVSSFCLALAPLFPLLLILGPLRWLEWRHTAFAMAGEQLLIRTGWWRRRTLLLPLANVQSLDLAENALARRFGIATLVIGTAGGSLLGHRIPSLPRKEASLLRRDLLSKQP